VSGATVAEALARVRRAGKRVPTVDVLPVTDLERKLIGVVTLRDLVLAEPESCVDDLLTGEVHAARVDDDREQAAVLIRREDLLALPVVDHEGRVVGLISVDDAMEVLLAEETEDIERAGASQPLGRPYLGVKVGVLARARVLWLLVLIVAAALTVNVLQVFEDTLEAIVTLALFVPLVIGTGGNAGAQAATVVVRAMAVGELRFADLPRVVWREVRVGLLLGMALAAVSFVPISLLVDPGIATVVSVTLVGVCAWATAAGSFLPMIAKRVGVDPAVVSAPLITTLVDATGLIIYFLVARVVLADQLAGVAG
jgi:magnesium transporter